MSALAQRFSRIFEVLSRAANLLLFTLVVMSLVTQIGSAQTFHLLYQFRSGNGGSQPYASLIRDPKGNLYGTTMIDGAYSYGTVFKISPAGKETVLYSFKGTGGDGANPVAPLVGTRPAISTEPRNMAAPSEVPVALLAAESCLR
jgi:uncharacterized repeat protein (TIGR03803 family)